MKNQGILNRVAIFSSGILAIVYSVIVLGFVTTSPDLRLRAMLDSVEAEPSLSLPAGIEIKATPGIVKTGPIPAPKSGDILTKIGEFPIRTFLDYSQTLIVLRNMDLPPGGQLQPNSDPAEHDVPSMVEIQNSGRFIKIEYLSVDPVSNTKSPKSAWIKIQSIPSGSVAISLLWFSLELIILAIAAFAYWMRPFDRTTRIFFMMGTITLVAFIGGYNWWIIAGSLALNIPFVVAAVLIPAITLHFFITYPRVIPWLAQYPVGLLRTVYSIPVATTLLMLICLTYLRWTSHIEVDEKALALLEYPQLVFQVVYVLRWAVYAYISVAGLYYLATLAALFYGYFKSQNAYERNQLKWIALAGLISTIPVGYSLYLAEFDRAQFALGGAGIPMFLASVSFMAAFVVGIIRYRLMLIEQIISRGMLFYVVSAGISIVYATVISLGSLLGTQLNRAPSSTQAVSVFLVMLLAISLLLWSRDRIQRLIDRRFFRQKYQLDKALKRMNRAVGRLGDQRSIADRMLTSCREVLQVMSAAIYLLNPDRNQFELLTGFQIENAPSTVPCDPELLEVLEGELAFQRIATGLLKEASPAQHLLRQLGFDFIYNLELDGEFAGFVALGQRSSGSPYSAEDLTFLNAMGQITSIALHSTKIHQDLRRLNEEMRIKVEKIDDQRRLVSILQAELINSQDISESATPHELQRGLIKGNSPAIRSVMETVRKVANSESTVFIRGESGTGKELLAQAVHENSDRREKPLVRVNCAALSPGLLESELFGHKKGAFTGAHEDRIGRFEMANGGSLFLDEIGDISLDTQVKLLRVLQERAFERVGGSETLHVDVRLITATHQNLEKRITDGLFREDLYYRLNVISITLPPLRERREDIFELAFYFLKRTAQRLGKRITHIDADAIEVLERAPWPGNIRQLENVIERAVVLTEEEAITLKDLPADLLEGKKRLPTRVIETKSTPAETIRRLPLSDVEVISFPGSQSQFDNQLSEPDQLKTALAECGGNKAQAARMLGMPRSTYYSKLKKYGID
ncbi:MAG: sigma 54-interacting transcriptional regulator [Planctomycetes bacterium]|nr:sigma 54-interacting transcriptional regulator [Planctomycetota bacterium]MCH9725662.1 sigma 54-interacting transcriptional regulator [Planctomycetota bacterium]MCH9777716.1 sigma 54-interacting transcriptional regulator [Planctomycetota bacterium]